MTPRTTKKFRRRYETADTHRMAVLAARSNLYEATQAEMMFLAREATDATHRQRLVDEARSFNRYNRKCLRLLNSIQGRLVAEARARQAEWVK